MDLERDDFSSNRHPALSFCLSMIFSEKPVPTFPDHALCLLCMGLFSRFCVQARRFTAEAASGTHEIVSAKDGHAFRRRPLGYGGQVALRAAADKSLCTPCDSRPSSPLAAWWRLRRARVASSQCRASG